MLPAVAPALRKHVSPHALTQLRLARSHARHARHEHETKQKQISRLRILPPNLRSLTSSSHTLYFSHKWWSRSRTVKYESFQFQLKSLTLLACYVPSRSEIWFFKPEPKWAKFRDFQTPAPDELKSCTRSRPLQMHSRDEMLPQGESSLMIQVAARTPCDVFNPWGRWERGQVVI